MGEDVTILKAAPRYRLEELARLAEGPLRAAGEERAVVFGSWARGTADGYSDLDLAVVLSTDRSLPERATCSATSSMRFRWGSTCWCTRRKSSSAACVPPPVSSTPSLGKG